MNDAKHPHWPESIPGPPTLALEMRLRRIARTDIGTIIPLLQSWLPGIELNDAPLLTQSFYEETAAFSGEDSNAVTRPILAAVLEQKETPIAILILAYEIRARAIVLRALATHPAFASKDLQTLLAQSAASTGRAMHDIDALFAFTELDDRPACEALENAGLKLCAIMPILGRKEMGGTLRYIPHTVYAAPLVAPELLLRPAPDGLLPPTAHMFEMLHGTENPNAAHPKPSERMPLATLDPEIQAALATRPGGPDTWPDIGLVARSMDLPPGLIFRQLSRSDIPRLIESLPAWYPTLLGSALNFLLTPAFYEETIALLGEEARLSERPGYVYLGEFDGDLAFFGVVGFDNFRVRTFRNEFGLMAPKYRRKNLSHIPVPMNVMLSRAIGAELMVGWSTLSTTAIQRSCERAGLWLCGLFPASERITVGPGVVKHAYEALYAAPLVSPEEIAWPPYSAMPARVAALASFVRGE